MVFMLSKSRDEIVEDLEDQVRSLRKEIATLRRGAVKRGASAYDDASDFASDLFDQFMRSSKGARKGITRGTRSVEHTVRDNPVATAIVGVAVLGLIGLLVSSRR